MLPVELAFRAWGDPELPAVVLIHSMMGAGGLWEPMARHLSDRFHLLAPDLRGHGRSPRPDSYRTEDYVADLDALVTKQGLTRLALVGHALGGLLAAEYALRRPERVWALVPIDINIPPPAWQIDYLHQAGNRNHDVFADRDTALAHLREHVTRLANDDHLRVVADNLLTESGTALTLNFDRNALRQLTVPGIANRLADIPCPTLFLRGSDSPVMDRASAIGTLHQIRHSRLVQVPRTGHHVFLDNPHTTAREIALFLNDAWRQLHTPQPEAEVLEKL